MGSSPLQRRSHAGHNKNKGIISANNLCQVTCGQTSDWAVVFVHKQEMSICDRTLSYYGSAAHREVFLSQLQLIIH